MSRMELCYILFGSNMGDKDYIFAESCLLINNRCGKLKDLSSSYESEPWGFEANEWFLNRLIVIETELDPNELMRRLLDIEAELGRVRHPEIEGYTSRIVDLDILYYGSRVVQTHWLTIPHPKLHLRRFALLPLCELIPTFVHPVLQMTQSELLECCPDQCRVIKIEDIGEQINN